MAIEDFIKKHAGVTEEYKFYNGEVTLRYDVDAHVYLLQLENGELEPVNGVTTVVHVIDKSSALIPWGVKMMYQKLLATVPRSEDGKFIPPMTIEEFDTLIFNAKNAHTEKLEDAGNVGHVAHAWIESFIKLQIKFNKAAGNHTERGILDTQIEGLLANMPVIHNEETGEIDDRPKNCCVAALDWMNRHNVEWISTEKKIYSRKYKYAGTLDGLCYCSSCDNPRCCPVPFTRRLTVADWKTSNYLYLEYVLQTAAYLNAENEEKHDLHEKGLAEFYEPATDRWVIRLGKDDAEFEPWHLGAETVQDDFNGFVECLRLVRRVAKIEARIQTRKTELRALEKADRDEARAKKEAEEKAERERVRAKKEADRIAAHAIACPESKSYKGSRKPTCTSGKDGGPCEAHANTYAEKQASKSVKSTKQSNVGAFPHKEEVCATSVNQETVLLVHSTDGPSEPLKQNELLAVLVRQQTKPTILLPATTKDENLLVTSPSPDHSTTSSKVSSCDGEHGGGICSFQCWKNDPPIGSRYEDFHLQLLLGAGDTNE